MIPCNRCSGLLVHEPTDFALNGPMLACANCGNRLDRVILRNRAVCQQWSFAVLEALSREGEAIKAP